MKCRASGVIFSERDKDFWDTAPNVCHLRGRRAYPELKTEPTNGILMSGLMHWWSDGRGGYRLKMTDPDTGEPAIDASKKIRFTFYDTQNNVLWTRVS